MEEDTLGLACPPIIEPRDGGSGNGNHHSRRRSRSHSLKGGECHVRFDEDTCGESEADISTLWVGDDLVHVRLGFLQLKHKYEVIVSLQRTYMDLRQLPGTDNANISIQSISIQPEGVTVVTLQVVAATDRELEEKCQLFDATNPNVKLLMLLHAKVLSKDKGTPLLKNGVRCIEHSQDDESEYEFTTGAPQH